MYEQCSESKLDSELKLQKLVYLCQRVIRINREKLFERKYRGMETWACDTRITIL